MIFLRITRRKSSTSLSCLSIYTNNSQSLETLNHIQFGSSNRQRISSISITNALHTSHKAKWLFCPSTYEQLHCVCFELFSPVFRGHLLKWTPKKFCTESGTPWFLATRKSANAISRTPGTCIYPNDEDIDKYVRSSVQPIRQTLDQ